MLRTTVTVTALGVLLLAGCSQSGAGTAPSPKTSPATEDTSATATGPVSPAQTCPNPHGGTCLGPLEPGQYQTSTFRPRITYTVPAGWTNFEDLPGNFWLFQQQDSQDGALGGSYLGIYQNVHAAAINCDEAWQEGVGTAPAELVAWYESVPGLIVSKPRRVKLGGLYGLQIDLSLEPGVDTCRYGPYKGIPLIIGDGVSDLHHVILKQLDLRLVILGWRKGNVTLEITNVKKQHSADEFRTALQPIIDSLEFKG
jgi:hypothetical protein